MGWDGMGWGEVVCDIDAVLSKGKVAISKLAV